jgi:2,3-dihydroxybenzoate decarboxylase
MTGKIALEEHFALPGAIDASYAVLPTAESRFQLQDMGSGRIAEMDRGGVELCILSHVEPVIQAIPNAAEAIAMSRRSNDYLAEHITKYPKRLKGFAALPMQDPQAAAQELTRCVKELGFVGALVLGFSQIGEAESAVFYDLPQYRPFWARCAILSSSSLSPGHALASLRRTPVARRLPLGVCGRHCDPRFASDGQRAV